MKCRSALGWLTGLIVSAAIISAGCDGDNDVPPPQPGTATLTGKVVGADNITVGLANAEVFVEGTQRSTTTGPGGNYTIENLPAGDHHVEVRTPLLEAYGIARAVVPLAAGETTRVNLAVLPIDIPMPRRIRIEPESVTVDVNRVMTYRAQILGPNDVVLEGLAPTWVVRGSVGEITTDGKFTALMVGAGQITAYAGEAHRAAQVVVEEPRAPEISSFQVNPRSLPATGGEIFVSASVSDGDGVRLRDVRLEIIPTGEEPIHLPMEVANPDTAVPLPGLPNTYLEASFQATWAAPPNQNPYDARGVQPSKDYSVNLTVRDRSGRTSHSEVIEFVVQGIDPPPPTPGI